MSDETVIVGREPGRFDPRIYQGEDYRALLTWETDGGDPIDITGWTIEWEIRETYGGVLLATFSIDTGEGADNEFAISLSAGTTADLPEGVWPTDLLVDKDGGWRAMLSGLARVRARVTEAV